MAVIVGGVYGLSENTGADVLLRDRFLWGRYFDVGGTRLVGFKVRKVIMLVREGRIIVFIPPVVFVCAFPVPIVLPVGIVGIVGIVEAVTVSVAVAVVIARPHFNLSTTKQ